MKGRTKDKLLFILGGIFLFILIGLLVFDVTRKGIFSKKTGLNIVVVGNDSVGVMLLRPEEEMVGWVKMPKGLRIKVYDSEARYPLESVWRYGVSEKNPYEIIKRSLGQSMGVVISRVIKIDDSLQVESVLGNILSFGLKTDISVKDRVLIRKFLVDAVKSKRVLEMSIPETVFNRVTDPDGEIFLEFNQTMSLWTKNKFVVEAILNENANISINNISGVSGKGTVLANQLESVGMHIVELKANTEEVVDGKGCVYSCEIQYEETERVLKEHLGCTKISRPDFVENEEKMRVWIKD
ncbi:MAG TPA: hypothetical protein VLH94_04390 [Spirochaetia bacterium]|nr:hypothetical protein [Spirochaetia bacterium]